MKKYGSPNKWPCKRWEYHIARWEAERSSVWWYTLRTPVVKHGGQHGVLENPSFGSRIFLAAMCHDRKSDPSMVFWLVLWNMNFMTFHMLEIYGNFIIPTDFHIFQGGWNHQPENISSSGFSPQDYCWSRRLHRCWKPFLAGSTAQIWRWWLRFWSERPQSTSASTARIGWREDWGLFNFSICFFN